MSVIHQCDTIKGLPTMPAHLISEMPRHAHLAVQATYRIRRVSNFAHWEVELCVPCFQHLMTAIAADPGMITKGVGYEIVHLEIA